MATVYTVGHSTPALDELVGMLKAHGVAGIDDVRRFAGSPPFPSTCAVQAATRHVKEADRVTRLARRERERAARIFPPM